MTHLNYYKHSIILIIAALHLLLGSARVSAQRTSLHFSEACQLFESNFPTLRNRRINDEIRSLNSASIAASRLPQMALKTDARWQSESIGINTDELPFPIDFDLPLYSIKAYGEITYQLLDGGRRSAQDVIDELDNKIANQRIETVRHHLKDQVLDLYIAIDNLRSQLELLQVSLDDIKVRLVQISAVVDEGILPLSERDQLMVQQLQIESHLSSLSYQVRGAVRTLSYLTGESLNSDIELVFPEAKIPDAMSTIRPELLTFEYEMEKLRATSRQLGLSKRPMINLYGQFGSGHPNPVNLLDNKTAVYGFIGLNFSWRIIDWHQTSYHQQIIRLKAQLIEHEKEVFLFEIDAKDARYQEDRERLKHQITLQRQMVTLQNSILNQYRDNLEEGIITTADYIIQVNAELTARQKLSISESALKHLDLNYLNEKGQL